ncbi:MAG: HAD-IA family hydrolase [Clostridia bacterium]|nr:HAD-IA family hydrolase [Clostridia bacterium]MBQ6720745.1 HAD-IA family hydrolase [Clostridia bacterium]
MTGSEKKLIIFTDIGDTIIDEGTEIRDEHGIVLRAECIPGARETTLRLHEAGYTIAMVADGRSASFHHMMDQHGLSPVFDAWIISEEVGEDKPSPKMFESAMKALGLTEADKPRIIMIGNNVIRDMRGANRFGIRSVLLDWSDRRSFEPQLPEDVPAYRIHTPEELFPLAERLEAELS